jgi:hypothetical protein
VDEVLVVLMLARAILGNYCDLRCLWEVHPARSDVISGSSPRFLLYDGGDSAEDAGDEDDEDARRAKSWDDENGGGDDDKRRKTRMVVVVDCSGIVVPYGVRDAQWRLVVESVPLLHLQYHHRLTFRVDFLEAAEKNHHCGPSPFSRPMLQISVQSRGQEHAPEQHLQARSW